MERFKTEPYGHQLHEVDEYWSAPNRCLWWEQGTGKTKAVIDTAASLYRAGKIDAILIIAPGGVHDNWIRDEVPIHMPDDIPTMLHAFQTKGMRTQRFQKYAPSLLEFEGMAVLAMTYDSIMTQRKRGSTKHKYLGAEYAKAFLTKRKVLFVVDEGSYIKTPGAQVTKRLLAAAKYAPYRRLLNGTPVIDSPMHAYSQVKWCDPEVWSTIGVHAFQHFKVMFGDWQKIPLGNGRSFPKLLRYRNLDLLKQKMEEVGSRIRKDDVLDLPAKIYQRVYYDLSPKQRKAYDILKKTKELEGLRDDELLTVDIAIVLGMRLQQITSGFVPTDENQALVTICSEAPRISALQGVVERTTGPALIWAKFKEEKRNIAELLDKMGETYTVYSSGNRIEAKEDFQAGKARFFIANQASGAGRGLTLTAAKTVIYYSNTWSLDDRSQSEARAHRIGQDQSVNYIDIIAKDTIDEQIVDALLRKQDISNEITGDKGNILDE